jgi:hypothetical protein
MQEFPQYFTDPGELGDDALELHEHYLRRLNAKAELLRYRSLCVQAARSACLSLLNQRLVACICPRTDCASHCLYITVTLLYRPLLVKLRRREAIVEERLEYERLLMNPERCCKCEGFVDTLRHFCV